MILARHAEALFWAGRQLERAETTTRTLDIIGRNSMYHREKRARAEWKALLQLLGLYDRFEESSDGRVSFDRSTVSRFLFAEADNPGSVISSVGQLRENIRTVRDRVPVELWEEVNRLQIDLKSPRVGHDLEESPSELFSSVRRGCQAMAGVAAEAMPRDEGYMFLDFGRMIERSIGTCRMMRVGLYGESVDLDAATVLRMASSLQAYRRIAGYDDRPESLARFLLTSERVPRTVLSCLRRVDRRLELLEGTGPGVSPARRLCGRTRAKLEFEDVRAALTLDPLGFLVHIEADVVNISEAIATSAFHPAQSAVLKAQFVRPGVDVP